MRREDDGGSKMGKNAKRKADVTRKRSLWPAEEVAMTAAKAASQKKREDKKRSDKKAKMDKNWAKRQGLSQVEDPSSDDDGNDDENDDSDEDEQLAPEPSLPRAPVTTTTTTTTTTSTAQQGRSAPVALVQVHMSEVDKELAAHRACVDRMCAPSPEAEEEEMPPQAGTASNRAIEDLEDFDNGFEMPF